MSAPAVFCAPLRYIQGEGAIGSLAGELERLGSEHPVVLCDPGVADSLGPTLDALPGITRIGFNGEVSPGEIDRFAAEAKAAEADVIIGVGGGKTLDTVKAVAHPAGLPLILVPTIASTDAPTSAVSVVYDDDGAFLEYRFFRKNPDVVVVDTSVIAQAPVRFLVAGIGDGLSTVFEAETSATTKQHAMAGGPPLQAALKLARLCYDTLLADGVAARHAAERGIVTPALDRVIEANTLLSGLGFESGGLAAAHSIHNGLTALHETHDYWHGEKVAFGTISLLVLEGKPQELIDEVVDFCLRVGLPVTLSDIGVEADAEVLGPVADLALAEGETIHNTPFDISPEMVVAAMLAADAIGAERRALLERTTDLPAVCA